MIKESIKKQDISRYLLFLLVSILVAVALIVVLTSFAAAPSADDYSYGNVFMEKGLLLSQVYWYTQWSGRYLSNILLSLTPLRPFLIYVFRFVIFSIHFGTIYSFYLIISQIFQVSSKNKSNWIISSSCLLPYYYLLAVFWH